jgi:hypothetical protein
MICAFTVLPAIRIFDGRMIRAERDAAPVVVGVLVGEVSGRVRGAEACLLPLEHAASTERTSAALTRFVMLL